MVLKRRTPKSAPVAGDSPADEECFQILYVEDDDTNWMILEAGLRGDYLLKRAVTSDEALDALDASAFDLILMDIDLKGSCYDGLQLTQYLKKTKGPHDLPGDLPSLEQALDTPIIFVTANREVYPVRELKLAGAIDVVGKPVNMASLHRSMKTSLQERKKEAEQERERREIVEQNLHEALMTKIFLIGDLAHRVNNPLNHGLGGISAAQLRFNDFSRMVREFFPPEAKRSEEEKNAYLVIERFIGHIDLSLEEAKAGILRAGRYVADLRVLGGVDGESPEPVPLQAALSRALVRVESDLGKELVGCVRIEESVHAMSLVGQVAMLAVALATWLKHALMRSGNSTVIRLVPSQDPTGNYVWLDATIDDEHEFRKEYTEDISSRDLVMGLLARHGADWRERVGADGRVSAIGIRMPSSEHAWLQLSD